MSALVKRVRALAEDYSAAFGQSLETTIYDRMLGALALLVLAVNVIMLVTAGGGR